MRAVSQIIRSSQHSFQSNSGIVGLISPSIHTPQTSRQYASGVKGNCSAYGPIDTKA